MNIILNGIPDTIQDNASLAQLLDRLDLTGKRYAVEINEQLIPRSQHADCQLQPDDKIEVVQAIGGG